MKALFILILTQGIILEGQFYVLSKFDMWKFQKYVKIA